MAKLQEPTLLAVLFQLASYDYFHEYESAPI